MWNLVLVAIIQFSIYNYKYLLVLLRYGFNIVIVKNIPYSLLHNVPL